MLPNAKLAHSPFLCLCFLLYKMRGVGAMVSWQAALINLTLKANSINIYINQGGMEAGADVGHVPALEPFCSPEDGPLPLELLRLFWCRQSAAGNFSA